MLSTRLILIASLAVATCLANEVHYNVACPGSNIELHCDPGQEIHLLSLHHGLNNTIDCDEKDQQVEVSPEECFHEDMLGWAKFICDKMENCRLPKPHVNMFECDNAEHFFVQAKYICKDRKHEIKTTEVCDGEFAKLECERGSIYIEKASYGRFDKHTCTETPSVMTFCSSYGTNYVVKEMCQGRDLCSLPVNPSVLGTPYNCDPQPKYLKVEYFCA